MIYIESGDEMEIKMMKTSELVPYENNPRHNEYAVDSVANSIREFGFKSPIIVDEKNVIINGHTRKLAADQLGMKEVPVIVADDLTDEQVRAFRLADNKVGEIAEWDSEKLTLELMNLDEEYMAKFGFEFEFEDEAETEDQKNKEKRIKALELKSFEHHDYLVFVFDNQQDWLNVVSKFDIGKVDAGYGETKKVGVGRVLNGKELLGKI